MCCFVVTGETIKCHAVYDSSNKKLLTAYIKSDVITHDGTSDCCLASLLAVDGQGCPDGSGQYNLLLAMVS